MLTPRDDRWLLTRLDVKTGKLVPHAEVMRARLAERPGPDLRISRDGRRIVYSDTVWLSSLLLVEGVR